jgi:hypothetical protein
VLDPVFYQKIEKQVKELYSMAFGEKAEGKMGNVSVLTMLNEMEKMIDFHLQDF